MAVYPLANLQNKITHIGLSLAPVNMPVLENPHMLFCALDIYVVISCVRADNGDRCSSPNVVGPNWTAATVDHAMFYAVNLTFLAADHVSVIVDAIM